MKPAPHSPPELHAITDEFKRQAAPPQAALKALAVLQEAADADAPPPLSPDELPPVPEDLIARLEEKFAPPVPTKETSTASPPPRRPQRERSNLFAEVREWLQRLFTPQFGLAFATLLILGVVVMMNQDDATQPVLRGGDKPTAVREATVILIGTAADLDAFTQSWDGPAPTLVANAELATLTAQKAETKIVIIADALARTLTVLRDGKAAAPKPVEQVLPNQPLENLVLAVQNELDALAP